MEMEQREEEEGSQKAFERVVEPAIDPYAAMNIVRNADGSLTRLPIFPTSPPVGEEEDPDARCFSKDVVSRRENGGVVRLRIYRPNSVPAEESKSKLLPVLVFFHGGGFICFSPATEGYHVNAEEMACRVPAIVVSVDYRLAPENPLPAAYDDAIAALEWVRDEGVREPWIRDRADLSRCFLIGSSAGGNIAYRTGLRTSKMDLGPVRIEGLILVQPFFGGVRRTESEVRLARDAILPSPVTDLMWDLSLPSGSDRDHEFCNPTTGTPPPPPGEELAKLPRMLVTGYSGDPLIDRQRAFVKMMEEKAGGGVLKVVSRFREGGHHAAEFLNAGAMEDLAMDVKTFVISA